MEGIREFENGVKYCKSANDQGSEIATRETNDCVVRAFAVAFNIKYDEAHIFCKGFFNRRDRSGTMAVASRLAAHYSLFNQSIEEMGIERPIGYRDNKWFGKGMKWPYKVKGETKYATYTVGKFLEEYSKGTYFILITGHAFAIKDGVVYGNYEDAIKMKVRIEKVFKIDK